MNMNKSMLTKRQIEVLEAVYHTGNPWTLKGGPRQAPRFAPIGARGHSGGAVSRMLDELRHRQYITTESVPSQLTVKGLKALQANKIAMLAISPVEMDSRIAKRTQIEAETEEQRQLDQQRRDELRATADAVSRAARLAKLREIVNELGSNHVDDNALVLTDDELLDFAARIADIEAVY